MMTLPSGFLSTRADLMIDVVMASLVAIVPIVLVSWRLARRRKWITHKRIQVSLYVVLLVVVSLFEYDLRSKGGIFEITRGGAYEGTMTLKFWVYFHMFWSIGASLIWTALVVASLLKFAKKPAPAQFRSHAFWGRVGVAFMLMTGVTAVPLYYFGFMA